MPDFKKTEFANGVRVVTEHHSHSQAVSVGAWIDNGTRDEPSNLVGVSHFVEHLVFKGTRKRSAFQIARALEAVGGDLNAYTTREYTCFHSISLKEHMPLSLDVLCDLVSQAQFSKEDFEKEKQVVLQELLMSSDNLEDYVYDLFFELAFGRNAIGRSILGTVKSLGSMTRGQVLDFYRSVYAGGNLIISAAGNLDHDEVVEGVSKALGKGKRKYQRSERVKPKLVPIRRIVAKPAEQVHILMGFPSSSFNSRFRFEGFIVNTLLGGGMTSKLYQSVREKQGLVYAIYSQIHSFTDSGICMVYAATEAKHVEKVVKRIHAEVEKIREKGITPADLKLFKTQVKGSILLGADDVENRMNSLGINEMVFGRYRSVDDIIKEINGVSLESVNHYIKKHVNMDNLAVLLLGGIDEKKNQNWLERL